jgi:hypothetical protein
MEPLNSEKNNEMATTPQITWINTDVFSCPRMEVRGAAREFY